MYNELNLSNYSDDEAWAVVNDFIIDKIAQAPTPVSLGNPPNKYHIRFNTKHNGNGLVWRVFENDVEHLVANLDITVPVSNSVTVEYDETKYNIYCEGFMKIVDNVAIISED